MELPKTWGDSSIDLVLRREMLQWRATKISAAEEVGLHTDGIFLNDCDTLSVCELLAFKNALLSGREEAVARNAAALQAFMMYRIAIYDQIDDAHFEQYGEQTNLSLFGVQHMHSTDAAYKHVVSALATKLELLGIPYAQQLAGAQYAEVLRADKTRNTFDDTSSAEEAITNHAAIVGGHARYIALLSGAETHLQQYNYHLAIAMAFCDDFAQLVAGIDTKAPKLTVPIAFVQEELGGLSSIPVAVLEEAVQAGAGWSRCKNYLRFHLEKASFYAEKSGAKDDSILMTWLKSMGQFADEFPNKYTCVTSE
jgi:hypothetical protein